MRRVVPAVLVASMLGFGLDRAAEQGASPAPAQSTGSSADGGSEDAPVGLLVGAGVAVLVIVGLVLALRHRARS